MRTFANLGFSLLSTSIYVHIFAKAYDPFSTNAEPMLLGIHGMKKKNDISVCNCE